MVNYAVVILSCSKYSDLWEPCIKSFETFWPQVLEDIFLVSDHISEINFTTKVQLLDYGDDEAWSDNLARVIKHPSLSKYDYIMLTLDDCFLSKPVDVLTINHAVKEFIDLKGNFLTFLNEPRNQEYTNAYFGRIFEGSPYRATATFSLWHKNTLTEMLVAGESAWDFEKQGARRSEAFQGFYSTHKNLIDFVHVVIKGKLTYRCQDVLSKVGIDFQSKRAKIALGEHIKMTLYSLIRKAIFVLTPFRLKKYLVRK